MYFYEFKRDRNNELVVSTESDVSSDKHFHNCMEIIYVIDGAMVAHIDEETYSLSSGQLCVVSCFSTHYYETCQEGRYLISLIPHRYFREVEKTFNTKSFAKPVLEDIGDKPFLSILHILQNLTNNRTVFGTPRGAISDLDLEKQLYYLCSCLVSLLIQHCGLHERHRISAHVADAVRIIENEFQNDLTVAEICRKVGTTQKELSLNFKKTMDMSIIAYMDQVRTLEAGKLLESASKKTVETVMLESGFKSVRSFLRHFKSVYGCTPTEYKNRQSRPDK